jgi:hypothetical protein
MEQTSTDLKIEKYDTLAFDTFRKANNNLNRIKKYYGDQIVTANVSPGTDERGNSGYMCVYEIYGNK